MNANRPSVLLQGRYLGVVVLVAAQVLVGFTHVFFGFWMLTAPRNEPFAFFGNSYLAADIYSVYTMVFGALTLLLAYGLWLQKRWSWIGTAGVGLFVIVADALTLLDLPSVPGISKAAGFGEISYSVVVLIYLAQSHVRATYWLVKPQENVGKSE